MEERLEQQMKFLLEADKLKTIGRQTYLADGSRKENDAEHSWSLAMMCMLLHEYAGENIDVLRTMEMLLVHDLVEIDAGDTYAYDTLGNQTKREREEKAADRIFPILPEDQAGFVRELWDEFEQGETPEAKFANALDKVQPITLNDASGGKAWTEHQVDVNQVIRRNEKTPEGSRTLWEYCQTLLMKNVEKGNLKSE